MASTWKRVFISMLLLIILWVGGGRVLLWGTSTQEVLCYTERITNAPSFNIYTGRNDPNNPITWTHSVPAGILDSVVRVGLYIEAYDVDDPPDGDEQDRVYFNGYDLGLLDGNNDSWVTVEKTVPVSAIREGVNTLQVYVDELGKTWKVTIRASELRFYCATPDPDFSIGATPEQQEISAGENAQYTVNLTGLNEFRSPVALSVSGLPTGASGVFAVNPLTPNPTANTTLTISTTGATPAGTYTLTITGGNGALRHETTVTLKVKEVVPPPDFTLSITPSSLEIIAGQTGQYTVTVTALHNFNTPVNLSVTGLPAGVEGTFASNPLTPTASTNLTITTTTTAVPGTYSLAISGNGGGKEHGSTVSLVIKDIPPQPGNFGIQAEPTTRTVYPGNSTDYQLTLSAVNGFNEQVQLSISGLPADSRATFAPETLFPTGQSVLTVFTTEKTPLGEYTLSITATGGSKTHIEKVTLNVEAKPLEPEFQLTVTPPSRTLYRDETSGFSVAATPLNGFNQRLELTVTGVPEGCQAEFSETGITPPGTSVLRLSPTETTPLGEYSLVITARGGGLEHTATVKLIIACRDFHVQMEATPTSGPAPLRVLFRANVSRDGNILPADFKYAWNFGDGSTSNEQNPVHTFENTGIYTVTLHVTDGCGTTKSATTTIRMDEFSGALKKEFSLSETQPGQELDMVLQVSNQGQQDFREVVVADELSPYLQYLRDDSGVTPQRNGNQLLWSLPLLKQGEVKTIRVRLLVSANAPEGIISNIAYLTHSSMGVGERIASNAAVLTVHVVQVVVQKQVEQTSVLPGGVVTYRLMVQNNSTVPLTRVQLMDELSDYLEFVAQRFEGGLEFSQQGNVLQWTGVLAVGQQVWIEVETRARVQVLSGSRIENTASLRADRVLEPIRSNTVVTLVTAEPVPGTKVRFNKRCEVPQVEVGRVIRFNITINNLSQSMLLGPVVEDYLPQGFTYVEGSSVLNGVAIADPRGSRHMTWLLPDIMPMQNVELHYQVVIGADVSRGRNENRASLRTRDNSGQELFYEDAAIVNVGGTGIIFYSGIEGTVYLDRDGDNFYGGEDTPLDNIEVRLSGGQKAITDMLGRYRFDNLFPGEYGLSVNRATIPEKYKVKDPYPVVVTLVDGLVETYDFAIQFQGEDEVGSAKLVGRVFYDKNRNSTYEKDDVLAQQFEACLDSKSVTVGNNGIFIFTHVEPGAHVIEIKYERRVIKKEINLVKGTNEIDIPLLFTGIKIIVSGEKQ